MGDGDVRGPFLESIQFAVEMFTTTGFGGDSPWESPQMNLFITVTDLLGMLLLVGALPVFVGPFIETVLSSSVPREPETPLEDHVVICSDTTRAQEFIGELDANGIPYVFVEPDGERASELYESGRNVIKADPETAAGLDTADLPAARALFADVSDRVDASIVLAAKEVAADVPVVSVVEDPDAATYHRLAGRSRPPSGRGSTRRSRSATGSNSGRSRSGTAAGWPAPGWPTVGSARKRARRWSDCGPAAGSTRRPAPTDGSR